MSEERDKISTADLRKFAEFLKHFCLRPAMYTGAVSFEAAAHFLNGYDAGFGRGRGHRGLFLPCPFFEGFHDYFCEKYNRARNVMMMPGLKQVAEEQGEDPFTFLSSEFQDYVSTIIPPLEQLAETAE